MEFKDRLANARKQKGYTQKYLAQKSGVSLRVIQSYERGDRFPRDKNLVKLANALDVNVFYLKDIDINNELDFESLRQLFIRLEDDNVFCLSDVEQSIVYEDFSPNFYIKVPVSEEVANMIASWKHHKYGNSTKSYTEWKTRPYIPQWEDEAVEDGFSTAALLKSISRSTAVERLLNHQYSESDFFELLLELNYDRHFTDKCVEYAALLSFFQDPTVPSDLLEKAFEPGLPRLSSGPVRDAYEKAKKK